MCKHLEDEERLWVGEVKVAWEGGRVAVQAITSSLQWLTLITPPLLPVTAINQHMVGWPLFYLWLWNETKSTKREAEKRQLGWIHPTTDHVERTEPSSSKVWPCASLRGFLYICLAGIKRWRSRKCDQLPFWSRSHSTIWGPRKHNNGLGWLHKALRALSQRGSAAPAAASELFGTAGASGGAIASLMSFSVHEKRFPETLTRDR